MLVTGAAGFAGGHLLEALRADADVVAWSRAETPARSPAGVRWQHVDLLDGSRVRQAIADLRPARVYHLAGATQVAQSWQRAAETLAANVLATHHLFDALRRTGDACRVLVTGSATVYASSPTPIGEDSLLEPSSPYAVSKLAQERLAARAAAEDGVEVVLTRSFNHTGPRQTPDFVAPSMARQIVRIERGEIEPVIRVGNLEARRDLTDVRDTVRAYVLLMERGAAGTVYNVATGAAKPIRAILEGLIALSRVAVAVEQDPALLRPSDTPILAGDASRLQAATGWTPQISFEQTLQDLLDYWRGQ